jgi:prevent-host-death family protein
MNPSPSRSSSTWQLQDAKAQFSAVVRQAQALGPQLISVRGEPAVVVLSSADYRRLQVRSKKPSFTQLMQSSPLVGLDLCIDRSPDLARQISIGE